MKSSVLGALLAVTAALISAGCTDLGVGRKCLVSGTVKGTQISAPALECMSKLCFQKGDKDGNLQRSVCTARCSNDDDCKGAQLGGATDIGLCSTSFVCAIATTLDPPMSSEHIACQTTCVCKDDIIKGMNGDPTTGTPCCPTACGTNCPSNLPKC